MAIAPGNCLSFVKARGGLSLVPDKVAWGTYISVNARVVSNDAYDRFNSMDWDMCAAGDSFC